MSTMSENMAVWGGFVVSDEGVGLVAWLVRYW